MKDLIISYTNKKGQKVEKSYDTVMDFTDLVESHALDDELNVVCDVHAKFFENDFNTKTCRTLAELYDHCINIFS